VLWYRYLVSQSNEFCNHNPLYCFSGGVHCCACSVWSAIFWWLICRNSAFAFKFCPCLRKSASIVHEMLKMAFVTIPWENMACWVAFSIWIWGNWRLWAFSSLHHKLHRWKCGECKIITIDKWSIILNNKDHAVNTAAFIIKPLFVCI